MGIIMVMMPILQMWKFTWLHTDVKGQSQKENSTFCLSNQHLSPHTYTPHSHTSAAFKEILTKLLLNVLQCMVTEEQKDWSDCTIALQAICKQRYEAMVYYSKMSVFEIQKEISPESLQKGEFCRDSNYRNCIPGQFQFLNI